MLPEAAVNEFIQIYEKELGIKLTHNEAKNIAEKVFRLIKIFLMSKGGDKKWEQK